MVMAEELRIGNWVLDHVGNIQQVNGYIIALAEGGNKCDMVDPIPLTNEILVKCGFEKKHMIGAPYRDFYVQEFNHQYYGFSLGKEEYAITNPNKGILWIHHPFEKDVPFPKYDDLNAVMDWPESNEPFAWHIAYLHQLQNLIHSICGEELIINL